MRKRFLRVCLPTTVALMIGACTPVATERAVATQLTAIATSGALASQSSTSSTTSTPQAPVVSPQPAKPIGTTPQAPVVSSQSAKPVGSTPPAPPGGGMGGPTPEGGIGGPPPDGGMGSPPPDDGMGSPLPGGGAGGAPPGGGSTSAADGLATASGPYTLDGETATQAGQTYTAANQDQSAVYVTNGGQLTLNNATLQTSGNTSSQDKSSFYGLNAALLASAGSKVTMTGGTISTSGLGANGAFAQGSGSTVTLKNLMITATGDGGHGVMATNGGALTLTNVDMTTSGKNSGVIATDRGGGTITASGGTVVAKGVDSPAIYSTGAISVADAKLTATGAEAAVIEGANTITLTDSELSSSVAGKWGVMIYQSMSGDAEGTQGTFTMSGGSLAYTSTSGPLFYVNNSTGVITLKGVQVTAASGVLIDAGANSRWGKSGANGGTVAFTGDGQTLTGDMTADQISSLTVTLQNGSRLSGAINQAHSAKAANLTLDVSSTWSVTADSYLTGLKASVSDDTITNITGNGHTVYYDDGASPELGGKTYSLSGGGYLRPLS